MDLKVELERLLRKNAELEMRVQELAAYCAYFQDICVAKTRNLRYLETILVYLTDRLHKTLV